MLITERAPLLGGLVDDQRPGVLLGNSEKRVDALGNLEAVDVEIGIGADRRGLICAGAPHLPIGLVVTDHFSPAQVGPAIGDGDFVTSYFDRSRFVRALARLLRRSQCRESKNKQTRACGE